VVSDTAKLESLLLANISCTHIYLEILQNIKYNITMIHYFMILCIVHCTGDIIWYYHMHDTSI
jgi:hypothetical protein